MIILERFEGNIAVIEKDGEEFQADRKLVDSEVKEGDVLTEKDGQYFVDKQRTKQRREEIARLQNSLWS